MGKTFVEKIFSKKTGRDVKAGDIVVISPDFVMSHDNTAAIYGKFKKMGAEHVKSPEKVVVVLDHVVPAATEQYALNHVIIREFVRENSIRNFYDVNSEGGICHQVLSEKGYALPGLVILGADSHTTTYGAFGAFSAGIGRSEVAAIWAIDEIWMKVPESVQINITGEIPRGISAKDIVLYIIGKIGADGATYKSVEFGGEVIKALPQSQRMVLANMSAEMGAKNGYIPYDEKTEKWIKGKEKAQYEIVYPDENAQYESIHEFDISSIEPQIAAPHTVDNVYPVSKYEGLKINQALIGTCTNGRLDDLEIAAGILKGKKISRDTRLLILPASWDVYKRALKEGIIETLVDAGAIVLNSGCGPCLGAHEGVMARGEVAISTSNRNFKGRMGSKESQIYLASPATVAASAIEGKITSPLKYLEGGVWKR